MIVVILKRMFGDVMRAPLSTLKVFGVPVLLVALIETTGSAATGAGGFNFATWQGMMIAASAGIALIVLLWSAVGWHRYAVLHEQPHWFGPRFHWRESGAYALWAIMFYLLVMLVLFVLVLPVARQILPRSLGLMGTVVAFNLVLQAALLWFALRLLPTLPAMAVGRIECGFTCTWRATRGSGLALLGLAILAVLGGWALTWGMSKGIMAVFPAVVAASKAMNIPGGAWLFLTITAGGISVVKGLFGLALLTAIYQDVVLPQLPPHHAKSA